MLTELVYIIRRLEVRENVTLVSGRREEKKSQIATDRAFLIGCWHERLPLFCKDPRRRGCGCVCGRQTQRSETNDEPPGVPANSF